MAMAKKLPIGIQTFSEIIQENYVYVDKTALIYEMITTGKCYFLSRPRRFGKSLLVSTLAEIFSGNKELFAGFAIASLPYDWKKYPVIVISFSDFDCTTPENLNESIKRCLHNIANEYHIMLNAQLNPGAMLQSLTKELAKQNPVVLLIDEYDYAILKHIHNPEMAHAMREAVKNFYAVIKGLDAYLKFVFLTGVSKFSQTSIFSGLNNLNDIGLDARFNTLLGYTKTEIVTFFDSYLQEAAHYNDCFVEELLEKITEWYDGYLFTNALNATKIYNPFSVLLFLSKKEFANYWFQTGTPTFLINLLKTHNYPIQKLDKIRVTQEDLGSFDIDIMPLATLLFQTGYLTICAPDKRTDIYTLSYPNRETAKSLMSYVFDFMTHASKAYLKDSTELIYQAFTHINFEQLEQALMSFFAQIPYGIQIDAEKYYQTIFYIILKMIGADIIVEQQTNIGRIDAVLNTKDTCFIIEFKINKHIAEAMKQIEARKYYQAYELLGRKVMLVGITFDTELRNISGITHKEL